MFQSVHGDNPFFISGRCSWLLFRAATICKWGLNHIRNCFSETHESEKIKLTISSSDWSEINECCNNFHLKKNLFFEFWEWEWKSGGYISHEYNLFQLLNSSVAAELPECFDLRQRRSIYINWAMHIAIFRNREYVRIFKRLSLFFFDFWSESWFSFDRNFSSVGQKMVIFGIRLRALS